MNKLSRVLISSLCVMMLFYVTSIRSDAGNVTSGTLGDNDGIEWTYDEDSKTLTLTGEDTGTFGDAYYKSVFTRICPNVEKIIVKDCTLYDCNALFMGLKKVKSITFENFDTSNVRDMSDMFSDCVELTELDVSCFDTSRVERMSYMFYYCSSLTELDVSGFNTSKVNYMSGMFRSCSGLTSLDLSGFDTTNVESMSNMFWGCSALTELDVSGFNTSNVTDMSFMFYGCSSLESLDVSNLDTSKVRYIASMFAGCSKLSELDLSSFDMSEALMWECILDGCDALGMVKSPKVMVSIQGVAPIITLPGLFEDEYGNLTDVITIDYCNRTLRKRGSVKVRDFVERMYTIVLERSAEDQGLNDWTKCLLNKEIDGATLVDMFVNSDEFVNRNTSDEEYIKILYRAVLGREADADGLKMWKDMLADDWTRDYILEGLVLSTEFKNICDSYGIIAAFEPTAESQVRSFVKRMYTVVLNRRADVGGLEDWTKQLLNGIVNGAKVADGFINSQEFVNRNLSDEKYVKVLYRAFFNREPDEGGFNLWMSELAKGASRREVMKGFVHSVEFSDLCAAYGIIRGEIEYNEIHMQIGLQVK